MNTSDGSIRLQIGFAFCIPCHKEVKVLRVCDILSRTIFDEHLSRCSIHDVICRFERQFLCAVRICHLFWLYKWQYLYGISSSEISYWYVWLKTLEIHRAMTCEPTRIILAHLKYVICSVICRINKSAGCSNDTFYMNASTNFQKFCFSIKRFIVCFLVLDDFIWNWSFIIIIDLLVGEFRAVTVFMFRCPIFQRLRTVLSMIAVEVFFFFVYIEFVWIYWQCFFLQFCV